MTWWQWLLAWFATSIVVAPLAGRWLKHSAEADEAAAFVNAWWEDYEKETR